MADSRAFLFGLGFAIFSAVFVLSFPSQNPVLLGFQWLLVVILVAVTYRQGA